MHKFMALRHRTRLILVLACTLVIAAAASIVIRFTTTDSGSVLLKMIRPPVRTANFQIYSGAEWRTDAASKSDSAGFATVIANERFSLKIHPDTTQIVVIDKRSGHEWRSNPAEEQMKEETVSGLLLTNLQSPFILEFIADGKMAREQTNALEKNMTKSMLKYDNGVQVTYSFPKQQLQIVVQYELTNNGLQVKVPTDGIKENGEYRVLTLSMLPFFGASKSGADGYFLVPDGPGGLIEFTVDRPLIGQGYIRQVYGEELSNPTNDNGNVNSGSVQYPVFGAKQGDGAFAAVIKEGRFESRIKVLSPGMKSNLYSINSDFVYRQEYMRKLSRIDPPVKVVQKQRADLDWAIEYRFLSGADANYVGMAQTYRDSLLEDHQLGAQLEPVKHIPLDLAIVGGDSRLAFNRYQYVAVTTFKQAADMVRELTELGVKSQRITYFGWQSGGTINRTKRFPVERKLGGDSAAKEFVDTVHSLGHKVLFDDNFVNVDSKSSLSAKGNGIYGIDETVFLHNGGFVMNPSAMADQAYRSIDKLSELGVDGIHYDGLGESVYRDYNPKAPFYRKDTASFFNSLLAYTSERMGMSSVNKGNDYATAANDFALMQLESSGDFMVDRTVPFYPIALHGHVSYSSEPGNLRALPVEYFLKSIEYGAMPSFMLSHDSARELKETSYDYLFSSRFENWKDQVVSEYLQFDKLAEVYHLRITGHDNVRPGIYETTYENGTKVVVDYNNKTFEVIGKGG